MGPKLVMCVLCCAYSVVSTSSQPQGMRPSGTSVHGISQARKLEWAAISFPRESLSDIDRWVLYHGATQKAKLVDKDTEMLNVNYSLSS